MTNDGYFPTQKKHLHLLEGVSKYIWSNIPPPPPSQATCAADQRQRPRQETIKMSEVSFLSAMNNWHVPTESSSPHAWCQHIQEKIHADHQGITKCMERARVTVWWPGITRDIKHIVGACEYCQDHKPSQQREPRMTTLLPKAQWQRVAGEMTTW